MDAGDPRRNRKLSSCACWPSAGRDRSTRHPPSVRAIRQAGGPSWLMLADCLNWTHQPCDKHGMSRRSFDLAILAH